MTKARNSKRYDLEEKTFEFAKQVRMFDESEKIPLKNKISKIKMLNDKVKRKKLRKNSNPRFHEDKYLNSKS